MKINITAGLNIITIGYSDIASYIKINKPVSVVWHDCMGSIGQYLAMMPYSESEREIFHEKITADLFNDFTGRERDLYETLKPLTNLFEDGEYEIYFRNGDVKSTVTSNSGNNTITREMGWHTFYPERVDLAHIEELKQRYRMQQKEEMYMEGHHILFFSTSWEYDNWRDEMFIATRPLADLDQERIEFFKRTISAGERPFAILMQAFYEPEASHTYNFIIDGHHKLQAYHQLSLSPPVAIFQRSFKKENEPEFDIEALADRLYPWQIKHILDHWDGKDTVIPAILPNTNSKLKDYIKNNHYKEYHDNGKLKHEGHYHNDHPEGVIKEFYESGQPRYERRYFKGILIGEDKKWFPSGQLEQIISYNEKGQLHGRSARYREDGSLVSETNHIDGEPDGYSVLYNWAYRNLEYENWHRKAMLIEEKKYDGFGKLKEHSRYSAKENKMEDVLALTAELYNDKWDNPRIWNGVRLTLLIVGVVLYLLF